MGRGRGGWLAVGEQARAAMETAQMMYRSTLFHLHTSEEGCLVSVHPRTTSHIQGITFYVPPIPASPARSDLFFFACTITNLVAYSEWFTSACLSRTYVRGWGGPLGPAG